MKKIKDAVYTEKYTDKQTGAEKKKYTNVGALFQRDDGSLVVKIMGSWINLYDPKAKSEDFTAAKQAVKDTPGPEGEFGDEIPF